jgi:hypothetical protein
LVPVDAVSIVSTEEAVLVDAVSVVSTEEAVIVANELEDVECTTDVECIEVVDADADGLTHRGNGLLLKAQDIIDL